MSNYIGQVLKYLQNILLKTNKIKDRIIDYYKEIENIYKEHISYLEEKTQKLNEINYFLNQKLNNK